MKSVEDIIKLLEDLNACTSPPFDTQVLSDIFTLMDESRHIKPSLSWQDTGSLIIHSRIIRLTVAAAFILGAVSLAYYLIHRQATVAPLPPTLPVVKEINNITDKSASSTVNQLEYELISARALFDQGNIDGLLNLLQVGLDDTRIKVADYLGQIGDTSVIPVLQTLADQWQGSEQDNPFQQAVEHIRQQSSEPEPANPPKTDVNNVPQPEESIHVAIQVIDKATGLALTNTLITALWDNTGQDYRTDDQGTVSLSLGPSIPSSLRISAFHEGYIPMSVTLDNASGDDVTQPLIFWLVKGVTIGGTIQDPEGNPVENAEVRFLVSEPQRFYQPHIYLRFQQKTDTQGRWRCTYVPPDIDRIEFIISHPEFADSELEMPRDLKLSDLRREQAIMILDKGIMVTGRVMDTAGNPISEARLLAGQDYMEKPWVTTDAEGTFTFSHLQSTNDSFLLTVQAQGYAPQRIELPARTDLDPVEFYLEPGRVLTGKVIDADGNPVPDAYFITEEWKGWRTVRERIQTNKQGRFMWDSAPHDGIWIRIFKQGYRGIYEEVTADDKEQTFVLRRPFIIKGSVVDSRTGEPIHRFKLTPGIQGSGAHKSPWQTTDNNIQWFTAGTYEYTFSDDGSAYAVRIEADGYSPVESRFVDANEQGATINISLTKGQGPAGYVFDAQGNPVEKAEVYWANHIQIKNGYVINKDAHTYQQTDSNGYFQFNPENQQDPLLALCDQGMGFIDVNEQTDDLIIMLRPWARVTGSLYVGSQLAMNQPLTLTYEKWNLLKDIQISTHKTMTDSEGRFIFERVYPGTFYLANQTFTAEPGQTLECHLGGTGRTIKGILILPDIPNRLLQADLKLIRIDPEVPFYKHPLPNDYVAMTLEEVQLWFRSFSQTREGRVYLQWLNELQAYTPIPVEMDDQRQFQGDNVEPGRYSLSGTIIHDSHLDMQEESVLIARVWYEFEVPPLADNRQLDTPLDLGPIQTYPGHLEIGDPAPDFDLPTFGRDRIQLSDYRGKVLLLSFYTNHNTLDDVASLNDIKEVYETYKDHLHYAQVSIHYSLGSVFIDKKAIEASDLTWPHALGHLKNPKELIEYDVPNDHLPWNILIDPEGYIIAIGLEGEALRQALEQALAGIN